MLLETWSLRRNRQCLAYGQSSLGYQSCDAKSKQQREIDQTAVLKSYIPTLHMEDKNCLCHTCAANNTWPWQQKKQLQIAAQQQQTTANENDHFSRISCTRTPIGSSFKTMTFLIKSQLETHSSLAYRENKPASRSPFCHDAQLQMTLDTFFVNQTVPVFSDYGSVVLSNASFS